MLGAIATLNTNQSGEKQTANAGENTHAANAGENTHAANAGENTHAANAGVRIPVKPIAIFLALLLALVAWYQFTDSGNSRSSRPQIDGVALRFEDAANGNITVIAHPSNIVVQTITGEAPFIRGVLRSLVRARKQNQLGAGEPFWLGHSSDGASSIEDRLTGARVELDAFGQTNLASFTQIYVNASHIVKTK